MHCRYGRVVLYSPLAFWDPLYSGPKNFQKVRRVASTKIMHNRCRRTDKNSFWQATASEAKLRAKKKKRLKGQLCEIGCATVCA
jgi:hypothetical protein